ncbi:unnamed protein product, partial [Polarella glacialis]
MVFATPAVAKAPARSVPPRPVRSNRGLGMAEFFERRKAEPRRKMPAEGDAPAESVSRALGARQWRPELPWSSVASSSPSASSSASASSSPLPATDEKLSAEALPRPAEGAPASKRSRTEAARAVAAESPGDRLSGVIDSIDIYSGPQTALQEYRPRWPPLGERGLEVYALVLGRADEVLRKRVEVVLHAAWPNDREAKQSISFLLGLHLKCMQLRSGRQTARCQAPSVRCKGGHWLIW